MKKKKKKKEKEDRGNEIFMLLAGIFVIVALAYLRSKGFFG
jgi:hypothetical protein